MDVQQFVAAPEVDLVYLDPSYYVARIGREAHGVD